MQLVEQGRLSLDADVTQYLPENQIKLEFDTPITLRHLMTHTAGFEDRSWGFSSLRDPSDILPLGTALKEFQPRQITPPGSVTAYSNYGASLAGLIVATVSGISFNQYIEKYIFNPLNMQYSTFEEPVNDHLVPFLAKGYEYDQGSYAEQPFEIIANLGPSGSMSSSAADIHKFADAIIDGANGAKNPLLKPESIREMLSDQFSMDERLPGLGLGFVQSVHANNEVYGHLGDLEDFHSDLSLDTENGIAIFVSFTAEGGNAIRSAFVPAFYRKFLHAPMPTTWKAKTASTTDLSDYVGTFAFWRSNFSTLERFLQLPIVMSTSPSDDGNLNASLGGNNKRFKLIDKDLFLEQHEGSSLMPQFYPKMIAFQRNASDEVMGLTFDSLPVMSMRKLSTLEQPSFNGFLVGLSLLGFMVVILRWIFSRNYPPLKDRLEQRILAASRLHACAHMVAVVSGIFVLAISLPQLSFTIPMVLRLWLMVPIIATIGTLVMIYATYLTWRRKCFSSVAVRISYTTLTIMGAGMVWFYYFWNLLGFHVI